MSKPTGRYEWHEVVLQECKDEYDDLAQNWRSLDAKAQGVIAVCGVFVGAVMALVVRSGADPYVQRNARIAEAAVIVLLLAAVGYAHAATRIRTAESQPDGTSAGADASVLMAAAVSTDLDEIAFIEKRIAAWREGNANVWDANEAKADALATAQALLAAAIGTFGVLTLLLIAGLL